MHKITAKVSTMVNLKANRKANTETNQINPIKAVLFDFDGVIVQSEPLHRQTFLQVLAPFGISVTEARWYREFAGTGSRHIFEVLVKENSLHSGSVSLDRGRGASSGTSRGTENLVDSLIARRKELYEARVKAGELNETPGIRRFLRELQRSGIKRAIVSGSHRSNIEVALSVLGLSGQFDLIVGGDDLKERKPDPAPFLYAARVLGVLPSECVAVEDSIAGCTAVKKAGMRLVVVRSPISKDLYGFDEIITDFSEFRLESLK